MIQPNATNRQLAVVDVTVVNRTSTIVPMLVDTSAAQLGDRRGGMDRRIEALNPYQASTVVDTPGPNEDKFKGFLWGAVELGKDLQVSGWMVFDVPKGLRLATFWWKEGEDIIYDFVEYRRF